MGQYRKDHVYVRARIRVVIAVLGRWKIVNKVFEEVENGRDVNQLRPTTHKVILFQRYMECKVKGRSSSILWSVITSHLRGKAMVRGL